MTTVAKSPDSLEERPRDDLRPKSGDSLKVHTIKYSRAAAIKAVYHATVSCRAFRDGAVAVAYYVLRRKRCELSDAERADRGWLKIAASFNPPPGGGGTIDFISC